MKLGLHLPTFQTSATPALEAAAAAAEAGLDGVFAFDHLWPMGSPARPALAPFPVLAAVLEREPDLIVGPLVARVGLVATSVLHEEFATLRRLAPGRVIAAVGAGDSLSEAEMVAYDRGGLGAEERRALLEEALAALRGEGELWCGGGGNKTLALARRYGAVVNLWGQPPTRVAALASDGPVSWAGPLGEDVATALDALADAGATWAVAAAPYDLAALGEWRRAH